MNTASEEEPFQCSSAHYRSLRFRLEDAMAWKVNHEGVHQWAVRGGGLGNDRLHDAASVGDGGIVAAGVSFSTSATFG